jgi:DNA-binding XRE family transcriptional regulator
MKTIRHPTKDEIREARIRAGLRQEDAANLVHLGHLQRWGEYERGDRNIDVSRWELFLIKTDQHPLYSLKARKHPRRASTRERAHAREEVAA